MTLRWKPDENHPRRLSAHVELDSGYVFAIVGSSHEFPADKDAMARPEQWSARIEAWAERTSHARLKLHLWCNSREQAQAWCERKIAELLPIMQAMVQS